MRRRGIRMKSRKYIHPIYSCIQNLNRNTWGHNVPFHYRNTINRQTFKMKNKRSSNFWFLPKLRGHYASSSRRNSPWSHNARRQTEWFYFLHLYMEVFDI